MEKFGNPWYKVHNLFLIITIDVLFLSLEETLHGPAQVNSHKLLS